MILCIVSIIFLIILTIIFLTILSTPYYYDYYIINYNYTPFKNYLNHMKKISHSNNINDYNNYKVIFIYSHDYQYLPNSAKYSIRITKEYCKKYNYNLVIKNHYPNYQISPYWLRVYDLLELSKIYDDNTIFVYLDLDATINPKYFNININKYINTIDNYDNHIYDIYIGKDNIKDKYLNTGVIFLKNTKITKDILNIWIKLYNKNNWIYNNKKWKCIKNNNECIWAGDEYEQGALNLLYNNNFNNIRNNIKILHMSNCSNRYYNYDSFIFHLMNYNEKKRLNEMKYIYFNITIPFYNKNYKLKELYSLLLNKNFDILNINDNIKTIPNNLFQTYYNKNIIPNYIFDNINKYAKNYNYYLLDDEDAEIFLNKYFNKQVINKFKNLKLGAHKADLLRYCLLYIYGGIYLDIKTILIKNLDDIFVNKTYFYSCISNSKDHIYQGIIASPPSNILFLVLIFYIINIPQNKIDKNYLIFVADLYNNIKYDLYNKINYGLNLGKKYNYYLFNENCDTNISKECPQLDRYNYCCAIYDNDKKIFIGRDPTFPWK